MEASISFLNYLYSCKKLMQNKQKKSRITQKTFNMSGYKNFSPRGGKNRGTMRYRPKELQASDPQMTERQRSDFGRRVQEPDQLWAMVMNDDIQCKQFDCYDWEAFEQAAENRRISEENLQVKAENEALKAEIAALKAENAALKQQQQNQSPNTSGNVQPTPYKDAVTISQATIQLRKFGDFFRRVRIFFLLLDNFNQIIKHLCKFEDCEDGDVEIEGAGSVLRKIFEMVTSTSAADISENILTIPDLDYKFYGSRAEFEEFATKVSLWITKNKLNIPDTHFIIGVMRRFTARKPMSNGGIAEYEKFTIQVIDSATKEVFMIDITLFDGSTVFPCDFTVNSFAVSPTHGIFVKDPSPIRRNAKSDFLSVLRDVSCRTTACMTRRSEWDYDDFSLNFLLRGFKMHQAGYQMFGSPILEVSECPIMGEESLCVKLTGCNCSKQKDKIGKPIPLPVILSISSTIGIFDNRKRCPSCRGTLTKFVCLPEKSKQDLKDPLSFSKLLMSEPQQKVNKSELDLLMERAEKMSNGFKFTAMKNLSPQSEEVLKSLAQFSRRFMSSEERDEIERAFASPMRSSGGAAAPVLASLARGGGGAAAPALASSARGGGGAAAPVLASLARGGGGAAAPVLASLARGGGAAAPARRPQFYYDSSDSDNDFIHYIRRGS
jgi:hypothetical protein